MFNVQVWKLSVLICSGQLEAYPHTRYYERDKMNILFPFNFFYLECTGYLLKSRYKLTRLCYQKCLTFSGPQHRKIKKELRNPKKNPCVTSL
jgi:hypothetical protein